jgi:hypothetical protein
MLNYKTHYSHLFEVGAGKDSLWIRQIILPQCEIQSYTRKTLKALQAPVFPIRDVYPGFEIFNPGSRVKKIPDPGSGSALKNFSTVFLTQKLFLSSWKHDPGCSSPDPGS